MSWGRLYKIPRRLHESKYFDKIYSFNIEHIKFWRERYPHHAQWMLSVVAGLKDDNYSRMAFGTILGSPEQEALFCSCIVTKNPFTTYLELKNFLFFDKEPDVRGLVDTITDAMRSDGFGALIDRIITFAENRGYPKLTTELFNRNENDHQIIKWLVEKDFYITGNQARRYRPSDEIVHLSYDVNAVYGYDPFDYYSKAKWIAARYFEGMHVYDDQGVVDIIGYNMNDEPLKISRKILKFGSRRYELPPYSRLNTSSNIIIFEEYFQNIHELKSIDDFKSFQELKGVTYIFDFSANSFAKELIDKLRNRALIAEYFGPLDLEKLLCEPPGQVHANSTASRRENRILNLPYSKMGGFLAYSDPNRFNRDLVKKIQDEGAYPLYIKIGPKGRFLQPSQPLLFCYHMDGVGDNALKIWGYADLESSEPVDLNKERDIHNSHKGDAEILWDFIEAINDGDDENQPKRKPIWTKEQFGKHARYNATCEVVCLSLEKVHYFEPPLSISVLEIQSRTALEEIKNGTDIYLSSEEIARITKIMHETPSTQPAPKAPPLHHVQNVHCIANCDSVTGIAGDVIFIHGIDGNPTDTWTRKETSGDLFWPKMLGEQYPWLRCISLEYEARSSGWSGGGIALNRRAQNILGNLEAANLGKLPLVFITHSLGGLVVKQMLRFAADQNNPHWKEILGNTKGIVFLSTPHAGSNLATFAQNLGLIYKATPALKDLAKESSYLEDLNNWYKTKSVDLGIRNEVFYETRKTSGVLVVDRLSADVGVNDVLPRPLDCDHIDISKPTKSMQQYVLTSTFIDSLIQRPSSAHADCGEAVKASGVR